MGMKAGYDQKSGAVNVKQDSGYSQSFKAEPSSNKANASGVSRRDSAAMQLLNADRSPCTDGKPAYLELAQKDGSTQMFSAATGDMVSLRTKNGAVMTAESYQSQVQVQKDALGQITRIDSDRDGRMEFERTTNKLVMNHYSRAQVMGQRARGAALAAAIPAKSYSYEWNAASRTMNIVNQEAGKEPVYIERKVENSPSGKKVTIIKGLGDERVVTIYEQNDLPGGKWEEIKTVKGINDSQPTSCVRTVKQSTDGGWLTLAVTEGYGSSLAQTATYTYNAQYRVSLELKPDGGYTKYEYDNSGRVTSQASPWADGEYEKVVRTTYADLRFNDYRPAQETVLLRNRNGVETEIKRTQYSYEDSVQVNRVTTEVSGLGVTGTLTSIEERYGEEAENVYSRGRLKMEQGPDGVEKNYSYEYTSEFGAAWLVTQETNVDAENGSGLGERLTKYTAADGTIVREEKHVYSPDGWTMTDSRDYEYDDQKRVIRSTQGNGRTSTTVWGCCGPLKQVDEDGVTLSYGYSTARQLVEVIRSATETTPETITSYTRDASGRIRTERVDVGPMTRTSHASYDILGRMTEKRDALGRITRAAYENNGLKTTITYPTGSQQVTEKHYDGSRRSQALPGRRKVYFSYELAPDRTRIRIVQRLSPTGLMRLYDETDGLDRITASYVAAVNPVLPMQQILLQEFNAKGQLAAYQERGALTRYEYDAAGRLCKKVVPLSDSPNRLNSRITEYGYHVEKRPDGCYRITATITNNDKGGLLIFKEATLASRLDPVLAEKTALLDVRGQETLQWEEYATPTKRVRKTQRPTSRIVEESVVVDGFPVSLKDSAGVTRTMSRQYLASGSVLSLTDGRGNVSTITRDIMERPLVSRDAKGSPTTKEYDPLSDNVVRFCDAMGYVTYYRYDAFNRKIAEYGTGIHPACFGYDEDGNQTSVTRFRLKGEIITSDPTDRTDGDTTRQEYAWQEGLLLKKVMPDGSTTTYQYGEQNRLDYQTNARGHVTEFVYDYVTQELVSSLCDEESTPDVSYTYNYLGGITGVTDGAGSRSFSYDEYGAFAKESGSLDGVEYSINERYDAYGRPAGHVLKKGVNNTLTDVSLGYADDGRLQNMALLKDGAPQVFGYDYLAGSSMLSKVSLPGGLVKKLAYEAQRDLLTGISYQSPGGVLATKEQSCDEIGFPMLWTQSRNGLNVSQERFSYSQRNELVSVMKNGAVSRYAYDNAGNRETDTEGGLTTSYETNSLDQYALIGETEEGGFTPTYDADGNQTLVKTSTGLWAVEYNAAHSPVKFTQESTGTVVEAAYDYMGRRWKKVVRQSGTVIRDERYLYRGYLQVAALDMREGGKLIHALLWDEAAQSRPLALMKGGKLYLYTHDFNKNVTEVYDADHNLAAAYEYTPYGAVTSSGTLENPVQWSSEIADETLGLSYYNFRYYNPRDGRWLTKDQTLQNDYLFCLNNPAAYIDVLGNAPDKDAPELPGPFVPTPAPAPKPEPKAPDLPPPYQPEPKPKEKETPDLGEPDGVNPIGNCASESMGEIKGFDPVPGPTKDDVPKEFEDRGCRKVSGSSDCKPKKERHVVYTIDENTWNDWNSKGRAPEYHVVGEDCNNPGTYRTQQGKGKGVRKNIKDPVKSTKDYFDAYDAERNQIKLRPLKNMHMCCPCKKQSSQ